MMNHYESMLNLTFEIEGLISLLQKRDDEGVNEVKSLLKSKVKALYQGVMASDISEQPAPTDISEPIVLSEQTEVSESQEIPVSAEVDVEIVTEPIEVAEAESVEDVNTTDGPVDEEADDASEVKSYVTSLPVFTINDKFRFRRELFANSEADFVDTLNVISAMSSFEEAEDYLYNDLCWDSASDEVADFMAVIKDYFDKR